MTYQASLHQKILSQRSNSRSASSAKSNWWSPLWKGLAVEPSAKHFKAMKGAVWLYLYLLTFANRTNGKLFRRISTIANDTGLSRRTVSRWLKSLKDRGYIETCRTDRSLQISITKWKPINKR